MELISRQVHKNVHEYRAIFDDVTSTDLTIGHLSDVHYDSVECDRKLLTQHLKSLEGKFGFVVINGDLYDAMQGKYDPRGSKEAIRPEYKHSRYIDMIIEDCVEYLAQFDLQYHINYGNHETNLVKRLETDVIKRTQDALIGKNKKVNVGAYEGYIVVKHCTKEGKSFNNVKTQTTWYHHGSGGNSPRSKGIMTSDIDVMQHPSADVIVKGHDHNSWYLPVTVRELNQQLAITDKTIHNIRTGSYKTPTREGMGWEVEKGFQTTTMGGWELTNNYSWAGLKTQVRKL